MGYWSIEASSKVANAVGRPLCIDSFTFSGEKIAFVRILIEVFVSLPFASDNCDWNPF